MAYKYNMPLPDDGELMTVDEFEDEVDFALLGDSDGFGRIVRDNMMANYFVVKPTKINEIPNCATHVIWFQR